MGSPSALATDDSIPIHEDEVLYRRIPVSRDWYQAGKVEATAFAPLANDTTGISLTRAGYYRDVRDAANGPSKKGYYVASIKAKDLVQNGINVVAAPTPGVPGHAEIPDLNCSTKTEVRVPIMFLLSNLVFSVDGPFGGSA